MGADMSLTIPHGWIRRFNHSGFTLANGIERPLDPRILAQLTRIPEFNKAYLPDGLAPEQFETYGAACRTLLQFLAGYDELVGIIRGFMITVR